MARYEQSYSGPRRTRSIGVKLTPDERAELEAAAAREGAPLSAFVRELCLPRCRRIALAARRYPEARALLYELRRIGNNLNQLARWANTYRRPARADALACAIRDLKAAVARVVTT